MERNEIHSPVEVDEGGWRGRVVGVTRIGAKAGFAAALVLAILFGMIVYGISTAGHRRAANANGSTALTKASEQQKPWWNAFPDAQPSPPLLPSAPPVPAHVPPLTTNTQTARTSEDAQISAARMQALEAEQEREQRRRALLDAAAMAPVAVRLNDGAPPTPGNSSQGVPGTQPTPSVPAIGPNSGSSQMGAAGSSHDQLFAALQDDPSPYELHAGSVIPATLLTGINAELPGTIVAQVRQDVFDSVTGQYLLVPRGTKLIGSYDSRIVQGQHRVMVAWTRLLYPDGSSLDLSGMEGSDPAGYAGFGANVDEHLNKVFNSALLLSIIGAGAQLSQPQQSGSMYAAPSIGQTIAGAVGQQIGNTSIQLTQRQLQIPATLEVPPGYLFDVLVDRDIVLAAPYAAGAP
jgi:type IV secretory pathway VirB10-like protein